MRIFNENEECAVTSRLVLMGNHGKGQIFKPDYSVLQNPTGHSMYNVAKSLGKRFLINKEELGNDYRKGECDYDILLED